MPKNGTRNRDQNMTQIRTPKCNPGAIGGPKFVRRRKQGRVEMIFIQRSAGRSYSIVQQTNNFNQRRKGNLGGQNCSNREHEYIHRPNVVKTCFTCRRYTVKSHAGEINSMLATMGVRPCVTAKLPFLRPWFWNLILLNLAAASCYFIASLVGGLRCNASRLLRMCWSSRGLPRRFLAPFNASSAR